MNEFHAYLCNIRRPGTPNIPSIVKIHIKSAVFFKPTLPTGDKGAQPIEKWLFSRIYYYQSINMATESLWFGTLYNRPQAILEAIEAIKYLGEWTIGINEPNLSGIVETLAKNITIFGDKHKGRVLVLTSMPSWALHWAPNDLSKSGGH